jgi:uncharacterized protein YndB with AHSA1/START domain
MTITVTVDLTAATPVLTWERCYDQPVERVWAALTDPEQMDVWWGMPLSVALEPEQGGGVTFHWNGGEADQGVVLAYDEPRHLGFSWDVDLQHWRLHPTADGGCVVVLTRSEHDPCHLANQAAAWHNALERLDLLLQGKPVPPPLPDPAVPELVAHYRETLGLGA